MAPDSEPTPKRAELPMRLTRLRVKNFRSIADIDIPLSPLTVLVGPNGSGKSNVVDALRFVRDVFARGLDQAVMDREGMGVIQRAGTEGEVITVGLEVSTSEANLGNNNSVEQSYVTTRNVKQLSTIKYQMSFIALGDNSISVVDEQIRVEFEGLMFSSLFIQNNESFLTFKFGSDIIGEIVNRHNKGLKITKQTSNLVLPMGLLSEVASLFFQRKENKKWSTDLGIADHLIQRFEKLISSLLFHNLNLADFRQPQQLLKETPLDEKGRNLAAVLRRLSRSGGANWEALLFALRQAVAGFENIEIETVGGYLATKLIYKTDDTQPRTSYLGQESDGTIRMLGLLAVLQQEPSQPFISIEEPEANIHPGALAVLAGVLDEASLRSQILVTTHSPDMLDYLPAESFLIVEKVGDTTHVGPLDASQLASVRKRLFTPGELLRMEGLQRQTEADSAA